MTEGNVETNIRAAFEGVTTVVDIGPRMSGPHATMVEQTKMRGIVKGCQGCDAACDDRFVPLYPVRSHRFAIVTSRPLSSEGRKFLTAALRSAGIGGLDDVARVSRIACEVGEGVRPTSEQLTACYGNCSDAIWHTNTDYLLLVGGHAKDLWRSDLTVEQLEGHIGVMWDRYVVMVIGSPEAVMMMPGGRKREERAAKFMGALKAWAEVVGTKITVGADAEDDPFIRPVTAHMGRTCVGAGCGKRAQEMDRDGLGWCREHWGEGRRGWRIARGIIGADGTEAMF